MYHSRGKANVAYGVMVYLKKDLKQFVKTLKILQLNAMQIEFIDINNELLFITAIYRLNCIKINEFIKVFEIYLQKNRKIKKHLMMEDMNIDILIYCNEAVYYCSMLAKYEFLSENN